jgi:hypothetical protein
MRPLKVLLFCILLIAIILSQSCKQHTEFALRIVRGGPDTVIIDNKTPLNKLIKRLNKPWDWVETGAGYWIGYTDDMFSIAFYKEKAIKPLILFITNTDSLKGKIGGIFTLHLIGINSHVAGRQYEEFKDTLARNALFSFIDNPELHKYVLFLLRRDPWAMDIPYIIHYLSIPDRDYLYALSALRRYQPFYDFLPLWQPIPDSILSKELDIYQESDGYNQKISEMIALKNALKGRVIIDKEILQSKEWVEGLECYKKKTNHYLVPTIYSDRGDTIYKKPTIDEMDDFFYHPFADYAYFYDDKIIYAYKNDSLFIFKKVPGK